MNAAPSPRRERPSDGRKPPMRAHPMLLSHIPTRGQSARQWGNNITSQLAKWWFEKLSDADRCLLVALGVDAVFAVSVNALATLDVLILEQASVGGWRLNLSPLVHRRFVQWEFEVGGPKRFRAFGDACALAVERHRAERPMLWDPGQHAHRIESVSELSHLLAMMRNNFAAHKGSVLEIETKLADLFLYGITNDKKYKRLRADGDLWSQFFAHQSHRTLLRASVKQSHAALLYDSMIAWPRRIQPESVGQAISRLKP